MSTSPATQLGAGAAVVDTNYTILAKVPKRYLPRRASIMGGAHARLRKFALALGDRGSVERS